ncbi:MAG: exodeoxyribonuclease VII large subunit [Bacteroidales bacterium]
MFIEKSISLRELQAVIKGAIEAIPQTFWIVAEISEMRVSATEHCYLELLQKGKDNVHIEAKASANIWANVYRMIKPYFELSTKMPLTIGMKVMLNVAVQYHELYGLHLNVLDIEPTYTVGEVALLRKQNVAKLQQEGVYNMNRELSLSILPQRIAIISSETAAGYGDFMQQLCDNNYGYAFSPHLFASVMQGKDAEMSILESLDKVAKRIDDFDVVAIIRGGGAQSDLNCFDSYILASHVAQFPLPIITGIGHDRDVSVVDMVAHEMLKTPTAAAEFLVKKFMVQAEYVGQLSESIACFWRQIMEQACRHLDNCTMRLSMVALHNIVLQKICIDRDYSLHLEQICIHKFAHNDFLVSQLYIRLNLLNPINILKRGYSIIYSQEGKLVKNAAQISVGDILHCSFEQGEAKMQVCEIV